MSKKTGVDHVVAFTFKEDVTEEEVNNFIEGAKSLVRCKGVLSVTVGKIFLPDGSPDFTQGMTYGLRVRLEDKEALKDYINDELHHKVAMECVGPVASPTAAPIVIDWECEEFTKENVAK